MKKRYYIAYGSNLNVQQMQMRCPYAAVLGTAELDGWELLFKGSKTGSYLTIEEREGGKVPVTVWAVTETDEAALDRYEGFPSFYYKRDNGDLVRTYDRIVIRRRVKCFSAAKNA